MRGQRRSSFLQDPDQVRQLVLAHPGLCERYLREIEGIDAESLETLFEGEAD